jgi:hypothetical protein
MLLGRYTRTRGPELLRIPVPRTRVNKRSLTPFLAVLFGGSPYLIRMNIAGEAGYERTLRVTQDDDARVTDQIQSVAGGQARGSIVTHGISIFPWLLLGWTAGRSLTIRLSELLSTPLPRIRVNKGRNKDRSPILGPRPPQPALLLQRGCFLT